MARGKYAQRAADKRAELEVTTDLATYQHRVAKLTAENLDLREQLAAQQRAHAAAERRLRAERDEGTGPQVEAMRLALEAEKARSARRLREASKYVGDLIQGHGWLLHPTEWAKLSAHLGHVSELITPQEKDRPNRHARRATPKKVRRIATADVSGQLEGRPLRVGPPPRNSKDADG